MYKFLIVLTGIYIQLIGLIFGLLGIVMIFAHLPKDADYPGSNLFVLLFFVLISILMITISVGLFMRKNWSRVSLLILSFLNLLMGVGVMAVSTFHSQLNEKLTHQAIISMQIFYGVFFVAIPVLFLIFFNIHPVKALFIIRKKDASGVDADAEDKSAPFGIKVLGVFYFFSVFSALLAGYVSPLKEMPLLINSLWLSGTGLKIYFAVLAIINLYLGWGFFRLWRTAWKVSMFFLWGCLALGLYNFLNISQAYLDRMMGNLPEKSKFIISLPQQRILCLITFVFMAGVTYYIYRKKKYFIN